ncbi:TetR/AcrR family transcriptional regulator [Couchioplanes caeruleus]|uniref:TetR/AcrR family transcriptional regulator n=1 Tax=Couchioplanes caeruleus TaxID=56438 RepID=UPI0020BE6A61|nr:TetR/AcrR family transcriptional regulator C-terminal domain-containing protein [Couchioplanes caeruleus]UQU66710.1 TetR/AcrR family transcriptional regulator [Couchioplanes caeruleus]
MPVPRGRPPARTRPQVVAAAIAVADAEGLEALTMRRLAAELGAGPMSLYTYVRDKEELVDLMVDQVSEFDPALGEPDLLGLLGWQRDLMLRHPWLPSTLPDRRLGGPNLLGYLERGLTALEPTGLPGAAKMEILALLTGFVAGYVTNELARARAGVTDAERVQEHVTALREAVAGGAYPRLAAVLAEGGPVTPPAFEDVARRMIAGLVG